VITLKVRGGSKVLCTHTVTCDRQGEWQEVPSCNRLAAQHTGQHALCCLGQSVEMLLQQCGSQLRRSHKESPGYPALNPDCNCQ